MILEQSTGRDIYGGIIYISPINLVSMYCLEDRPPFSIPEFKLLCLIIKKPRWFKKNNSNIHQILPQIPHLMASIYGGRLACLSTLAQKNYGKWWEIATTIAVCVCLCVEAFVLFSFFSCPAQNFFIEKFWLNSA